MSGPMKGGKMQMSVVRKETTCESNNGNKTHICTDISPDHKAITSGDSLVPTISLPCIQAQSSSRPVRDGHYKSLDYMLTPAFEGVKNLFESIPEIGGAYFRPTDKGITVVDLHPASPKPRIGVGSNPYIVRNTSAASLAPSMKERVEYLQGIRDKQRGPSLENQFEAFMIREAQNNHLLMPGCHDKLRFIHSQWRMDPDTDGSQRLTDLLAVDIVKRQLVILELKAKRDHSAFQQVQGYLEYFDDHWDDLMPFFTRVAEVMGVLYDCPELVGLDRLNQGVIPLVAWPGADGIPIVIGGDE
ncbi:MAG: hypothetical protein ACYC0V_05540 [Armatimonadota bacterium]